MGVATGCGCKEVIDFLILLIPTPLVSVLFYSSIPTFCSFKKMFFVLYNRNKPHSQISRLGMWTICFHIPKDYFIGLFF